MNSTGGFYDECSESQIKGQMQNDFSHVWDIKKYTEEIKMAKHNRTFVNL